MLSVQYICVIVKFSFPINQSISIEYYHILFFTFFKKNRAAKDLPQRHGLS